MPAMPPPTTTKSYFARRIFFGLCRLRNPASASPPAGGTADGSRVSHTASQRPSKPVMSCSVRVALFVAVSTAPAYCHIQPLPSVPSVVPSSVPPTVMRKAPGPLLSDHGEVQL